MLILLPRVPLLRSNWTMPPSARQSQPVRPAWAGCKTWRSGCVVLGHLAHFVIAVPGHGCGYDHFHHYAVRLLRYHGNGYRRWRRERLAGRARSTSTHQPRAPGGFARRCLRRCCGCEFCHDVYRERRWCGSRWMYRTRLSTDVIAVDDAERSW